MASHSFWYTPEEITDKARKVMCGKISLDPCSSERANERIGANEIFTIHNSCLDKSWGNPTEAFRTVWFNFPYSRDCGGSAPFVDKFVEQFKRKAFNIGITLSNANTSANWWHKLLRNSTACLLFDSRVKFDEDKDAVREYVESNKLDPDDYNLEPDDEGLSKGVSPRYANSLFLFSDPYRGDPFVENEDYNQAFEKTCNAMKRFAEEFEDLGTLVREV